MKRIAVISILVTSVFIAILLGTESVKQLTPKAWITVTNIEQNKHWFNFTLTFSNISAEEIKGETVHKAYQSKWNWDIEGIEVQVKDKKFYNGGILTINVPKPLRSSPPWLLLTRGGDLQMAIVIELGNEAMLI